jgi:ABC-2 type transport system permease protein
VPPVIRVENLVKEFRRPRKQEGRFGVIPVAFVAYIPASVLLNRTNGLHVAPVVAYGAPVIGLLWFVAAYQLWRFQVRHYQSSGS